MNAFKKSFLFYLSLSNASSGEIASPSDLASSRSIRRSFIRFLLGFTRSAAQAIPLRIAIATNPATLRPTPVSGLSSVFVVVVVVVVTGGFLEGVVVTTGGLRFLCFSA